MLHNELEKLNKYPFHMPGHKRNTQLGITACEKDITEIDGFDNLHSPIGLIKEVEDRLSAIYKSEKSFMLINGSTVGILASIFAVAKENDTVLIARNCHKSVYNACYLLKLKIAFIEPEYNCENGFYTRITQGAFDEALNKHKNAKAVIITSPTYEGFISRIKTDLPLIIDCAHGAHFGFGGFPEYPRADIVISSLHKTLPSLTQTAVLNVYNSKYIPFVRRYLDIFQTTSPSYVLMSSVSKCVEFLEGSSSAFKEYEKMLDNFKSIDLKHLEIIETDDKGKIILSCARANISAVDLADILRSKYGIEPEAVSNPYIIFMTSPADTQNGFDLLKNALKETDEALTKKEPESFEKPLYISGEAIIEYAEKSEKTELALSIGKISAEYVYAYPPDIPIIIPNQIITEQCVIEITKMIKNGINIISDSNLLPDYILTKEV